MFYCWILILTLNPFTGPSVFCNGVCEWRRSDVSYSEIQKVWGEQSPILHSGDHVRSHFPSQQGDYIQVRHTQMHSKLTILTSFIHRHDVPNTFFSGTQKVKFSGRFKQPFSKLPLSLITFILLLCSMEERVWNCMRVSKWWLKCSFSVELSCSVNSLKFHFLFKFHFCVLWGHYRYETFFFYLISTITNLNPHVPLKM